MKNSYLGDHFLDFRLPEGWRFAFDSKFSILLLWEPGIPNPHKIEYRPNNPYPFKIGTMCFGKLKAALETVYGGYHVIDENQYTKLLRDLANNPILFSNDQNDKHTIREQLIRIADDMIGNIYPYNI